MELVISGGLVYDKLTMYIVNKAWSEAVNIHGPITWMLSDGT